MHICAGLYTHIHAEVIEYSVLSFTTLFPGNMDF